MDGAFYPEAITDFEAAIAQREKDQRMARTYGMHFVDYFPHRELGVALFEAGNLERAQTEIERSLAQYPTAKARFYLDRIRKALILKEGKPVVPPRIRLDFEDPEIWTRDDPVLLSRFTDFVLAYLDRYGDVIDYVEIGAEVNAYFHLHKDELEPFARFYGKVYDAIKKRFPKKMVGTVLAYREMREAND